MNQDQQGEWAIGVPIVTRVARRVLLLIDGAAALADSSTMAMTPETADAAVMDMLRAAERESRHLSELLLALRGRLASGGAK